MHEEHAFAVYLMASRSGTLYVGVTNDIVRRVFEHKHGFSKGFTFKYQCTRLVYYKEFEDIEEAIRKEKKIKGWSRLKKENLIRTTNAPWFDLAIKWEDPFKNISEEEIERMYKHH
jgi:putative endonuclease